MKTVWSLLAITVALTACAEEERTPVAHQNGAPAGATQASSVVTQQQGVTNVQPALPPPAAPPPPPPSEAAIPSDVPPPDVGPPQLTPAQDYRAQALRVVAEASQQIDRLHRWALTVDTFRQQDAAEAAAQIAAKRDVVLQDTRELQQLQPPSFDLARARMVRNLSELQGALRSSWSLLPPLSSGMPSPPPLPPGPLPAGGPLPTMMPLPLP